MDLPKRILIKEFLVNGPDQAERLFLFAHGAGVGMASPFMESVAVGLAAAGIQVVRFHFPYMEESVRSGRKRPPNGGRILRSSYSEVVEHFIGMVRYPAARVFIGGKSMGGRIASMIADHYKVGGVVCFGYPFHPPRQADKLRLDHLRAMHTPMLICQGERDPFGTVTDVASYTLSDNIRLHWLTDGDHSFVPRKKSGITTEHNMNQAIATAAQFISVS